MSITRPKWTYRPGVYRCDRGWDSAGESFECRRSGVREVGTEWLCRRHAFMAAWTPRLRVTLGEIHLWLTRPPSNLCLRCNVNRCAGTWCGTCNEIIEAEGERRSEAVTWRQWWRGYPTIEG